MNLSYLSLFSFSQESRGKKRVCAIHSGDFDQKQRAETLRQKIFAIVADQRRIVNINTCKPANKTPVLQPFQLCILYHCLSQTAIVPGYYINVMNSYDQTRSIRGGAYDHPVSLKHHMVARADKVYGYLVYHRNVADDGSNRDNWLALGVDDSRW